MVRDPARDHRKEDMLHLAHCKSYRMPSGSPQTTPGYHLHLSAMHGSSVIRVLVSKGAAEGGSPEVFESRRKQYRALRADEASPKMKESRVTVKN